MEGDRIYKLDTQSVDLRSIHIEGRTLDIGGGGEGVISRLVGESVISIDPDKLELQETPIDCLKIIMGAEDLKFIDDSFYTVTSFFTLMYINKGKHQKVISEIYRVLKIGGSLLIWDVRIPPRGNGNKDIFVVPLKVMISDHCTLNTGYGVSWASKEQNMNYYVDICKKEKFILRESCEYQEVFFMRFEK